jgi:hypothetical protein
MLEHEGNEMMRPYIVVSPAATQNLNLETTVAIVAAAAVIAALAVILLFKRLRRRTPKP